ncbi:hypothetical protein ACH4VT_33600 [Streptomyces lydicus]|uniref:hypothetical protein n=1 Tax=Streptomyces lydicus TaxID=47763 RepID=UPI00379EA245
MGRAMDVVRAVGKVQLATGRGARLSEVAAAAALDTGTARRYLRTMLATQDPMVRQLHRGTYELTWHAPSTSAQAQPSHWLHGQLAQCQVRSGHIALLFSPYRLGRYPQRICEERVWGPHEPVIHDDIDIAPLEADAPGLVILAGQHDRTRTWTPPGVLERVQSSGYSTSAAPVDTHLYIAAPVMQGSTVAGAVAVMPPRTVSASVRARCVQTVMDTAGAMTLHLTGQPRIRIAA